MSDKKWFGSVWENAGIPAESAELVDAHNIFKPTSQRIMKISHEDDTEFTFRVDFRFPSRVGQFCMISMPQFMEMPIFISGCSDTWIEFTVQKVTQLTDSIYKLREGDLIQWSSLPRPGCALYVLLLRHSISRRIRSGHCI